MAQIYQNLYLKLLKTDKNKETIVINNFLLSKV